MRLHWRLGVLHIVLSSTPFSTTLLSFALVVVDGLLVGAGGIGVKCNNWQEASRHTKFVEPSSSIHIACKTLIVLVRVIAIVIHDWIICSLLVVDSVAVKLIIVAIIFPSTIIVPIVGKVVIFSHVAPSVILIGIVVIIHIVKGSWEAILPCYGQIENDEGW